MKPSGYASLGFDLKAHREWVCADGRYWLVFGDTPKRDIDGWPIDDRGEKLPCDFERPDYNRIRPTHVGVWAKLVAKFRVWIDAKRS